MKLNKLSLTNFRCFENRSFDLTSQFNLVIGNNATGKTTILEAVAIAIAQFLAELPNAQ